MLWNNCSRAGGSSSQKPLPDFAMRSTKIFFPSHISTTPSAHKRQLMWKIDSVHPRLPSIATEARCRSRGINPNSRSFPQNHRSSRARSVGIMHPLRCPAIPRSQGGGQHRPFRFSVETLQRRATVALSTEERFLFEVKSEIHHISPSRKLFMCNVQSQLRPHTSK